MITGQDIMDLKPGDRIKFKAATRWNGGAVTRVVNGMWQGDHPTVRYGGHPEFIVRPHEVIEIHKADVHWIIEAKAPTGETLYVAHDGMTIERAAAFPYNNEPAALNAIRRYLGTNDVHWESERQSATQMREKYRGWTFNAVKQ